MFFFIPSRKRKLLRVGGVKAWMEPDAPLSRETLDEDLKIVRVTLEVISSDVRRFSADSADAIQEALAKLDQAQQSFSHAPEF